MSDDDGDDGDDDDDDDDDVFLLEIIKFHFSSYCLK